ncbi:uracil-DNA glycosylase [Candidatus Parcubacteria bacterium]|nr:uracil-DNA glycosylase [Candidatus Parcubacteria bacterium]
MSNPKKDSLAQIKADIVTQNICPDLAEAATNLVMGCGNESADIVFIGEAPGKNEDLQGEPFVGTAGKFLNEMLAGVGLKRDDVYITNIVKYRPPNNRDPLPAEKKAFWPFLIRQLRIIRPKIIATLGRHSMEYFLPGRSITVIHGQPKRIKFNHSSEQNSLESVIILPLYHPAAALYNGDLRTTLIEDFQTIPNIIKSLEK